MAWRTNVINQRSDFILKSKSGEYTHSELCRQFEISRMTGYKWLKRFESEGLLGLKDRSRRPLSSSHKVSHEITTRIVAYRQAHPSWGATTIRKILLREFKEVPSRRTIHRILQDCNLVSTRRARNKLRKTSKRTVVQARWCNHIWTVDFKGWWRTKDNKKVYPLTIRDEFSKKILAVEMLPSPSLNLVKEAFIRCFKRYGLPEYIRSDNGTPFSFSQGLCGLSRLSAWWMKLGIIPNFIPPASPQYNGGHERMHSDIAKDMERFPARNLEQQQLIADGWREDFNKVRPHTMLKDKTPSEVYKRSKRRYKVAEPALEYPEHMVTRFVNKQGAFKYNGKRIFFTKSVGGENIGLDFTHRDYVDIWFGDTLLARSDTNFEHNIVEYDLITGELSCKKLSA